MRIAHVTATFHPHNTGTGNVALNNALELIKLGHEVHVFTAHTKNAPPSEEICGIQVHRLKSPLKYGNAYLLPSLFTRLRNFDLIHLHMPFYGAAEVIYPYVKLTQTPLVITHHQDVKLSGFAGLVSETHDRMIGTSIMKTAKSVCFTSLDYATSSKYAPLVSANKIYAQELPNGVDVERFAPSEKPTWLVRQYNLEHKQVILFVGVLDSAHYFKGVDILLQAFAKLERDDTVLMIVGKGNMLLQYQQTCQELGIHDRVVFAGFVPDEELADYYRLADTTVLPSTTQGEAFGLVLLESLACGTPVIASALPGVRSVVCHDIDGFLVEPKNVDELKRHIATMLADPARRQSMGKAGRKRVQQEYAWSSIQEKLSEIYRQSMQKQVGGEVQFT